MISPQYTPFSEDEARCTLGMPRGGYTQAINAGELQRSVHFDSRISLSTSMHSLVDIVRYDVLVRKGWGNLLAVEISGQCDDWLDALCDLHEERANTVPLIVDGDHAEIMVHLLPEYTSMVPSCASTTWPAALVLLFDVVKSWCYCYRTLSEMLVADGLGFGVADRGRQQYEPSQLLVPHTRHS